MPLGRFKDAMNDVAETIRRAFRDPDVSSSTCTLDTPGSHGASPVATTTVVVAHEPTAVPAQASVLPTTQALDEPVVLGSTLREEGGWETWAAAAQVAVMPPLVAGAAASMSIPPVPRAPLVRKASVEELRTRGLTQDPKLSAPKARGMLFSFPTPQVHKGLAFLEAMPLPVPGESWQNINKSLQMRYALELVKATGENIRSVEVLGVFRIPKKGVLEMRHDPPQNRLLLRLGPEARGAARCPFLLARRKSDRALLTCFLEQA